MSALRRLAVATVVPALLILSAGPALAMAGGPSGGSGGRIVGEWTTTTDGVKQSVRFAKDGSVSGDAGCNRMVGNYTVEGSSIDIGPLATTLMYCEGAMDAERTFVKALEKSTSFTATKTSLRLFGPKGKVTVSLRAS